MFPVSVHGSIGPTSISVKLTGTTGEASWFIPEEIPVAFSYNRRNYAIMMATPDDLTDFGLGFSLSEGIFHSYKDVRSLDIYMSDKGADLRFKLDAEKIEKLDLLLRRRSIIGSASCGLCGLENADDLFRRLPVVSDTPIEIDEKAILRSIKSMPDFQSLNQRTRTVHGAAWVSMTGQILVIREDVGRHNALDKLIGALAQDVGFSRDQGFVLMSSRCSYEIVEKAARFGVKAMASISAPTAFALKKAQEARLSVYVPSGGGVVRLA